MVQPLSAIISANCVSVLNLKNKAFYKTLPYQPLIRYPGDSWVICENSKPLDFKVSNVLSINLRTILLWNMFGVVPNFQFKMLIGAVVFTYNKCLLFDLKDI